MSVTLGLRYVFFSYVLITNNLDVYHITFTMFYVLLQRVKLVQQTHVQLKAIWLDLISKVDLIGH